MPRLRWPVVAALALLLGACRAAPHADAADGASARPVDLAAEEQAIRDVNARWARMIVARDTAGIAALYAADGLLMQPNTQPLGGVAGARKGWGRMLSMPGMTLVFGPTRIAVAASGDLAYEVGPYTFGVDGRGGRRDEDRGKYVAVWRKVDGAWKVAADISNSDRAAP